MFADALRSASSANMQREIEPVSFTSVRTHIKHDMYMCVRALAATWVLIHCRHKSCDDNNSMSACIHNGGTATSRASAPLYPCTVPLFLHFLFASTALCFIVCSECSCIAHVARVLVRPAAPLIQQMHTAAKRKLCCCSGRVAGRGVSTEDAKLPL